ncbi:MAG: DUF4097 family beta strand repeat protein [Candidatus Aegiribacteria sp.]|nr:DUF4097 family beta strand repeat protein [Candidatus Aegiribacteria sp.]
MNKLFSIGSFCSAVLFLLLSGCARYVSVTTEIHSIPANSTVTVSTFNGSITVDWCEGTELILEITRTSSRSEEELDKAEVEVTSGMITSIEAHRLDRYANVGVSLKLSLPYGTEIGELHTSNGSIVITGGAGSAQAHTSNGNISFENFSGSVSAETSNGNISVSASSLIYAASSNGSISGEISSIPLEGITLRTSNGAINIEIDSGLDADIEMDTSNGSISVTGEGFSNIIIDDSDGSATLGVGGNSITLRTSNGSIRVKAVSLEVSP